MSKSDKATAADPSGVTQAMLESGFVTTFDAGLDAAERLTERVKPLLPPEVENIKWSIGGMPHHGADPGLGGELAYYPLWWTLRFTLDGFPMAYGVQIWRASQEDEDNAVERMRERLHAFARDKDRIISYPRRIAAFTAALTAASRKHGIGIEISHGYDDIAKLVVTDDWAENREWCVEEGNALRWNVLV